MDDSDSDEEMDYALIANSTLFASDCSPIQFHSGLLAKIALKCPNLKTLTLVECLMGRVYEGDGLADWRLTDWGLQNLNFKWCEAGGLNFHGSLWREWMSFLTYAVPNLRTLSFVDCFNGDTGKCCIVDNLISLA